MRKIFIAGVSIIVLYSILVYAYGPDCQGPLNSSTSYTLDGRMTVPDGVGNIYRLSVTLNSSAPLVKIVITDLTGGYDVMNTFEYDVTSIYKEFDVVEGDDYAVYVNSGSTSGYALCESK